MSSPVIETEALRMRYGERMALDGLDLVVPECGVYALLGPNGAGKTTAVRIMTTLVRPEAGSALVLGLDVVRDAEELRKHIALAGEHVSVDADLTGHENLVLLACLLGFRWNEAKRRATSLLDRFDLRGVAAREVRSYSGGMRRRLDLAASLVRTPRLLFLDEPTTGLDPRSRGELWDLVRELVTNGTSVLLTTQYLDEADRLADRVGVIDHGCLVAQGTPSELKASVGRASLEVRLRQADHRELAADLLSDAFGQEVRRLADPVLLSIPVSAAPEATDVLARLHLAGIDVASYSLGQPTLDEVFLSLTGGGTAQEVSV